MIDRTIKYVDLYMIYEDLSKIPEFELPEGYSYRFFDGTDQDIKTWIEIEVSSGDIKSIEEGRDDFDKYYSEKIDELKQRCIFIVDDQSEFAVATATGFYLEEPIGNITGDFHWLAVREEYKGKGLSKPLITKVMKEMYKLGHKASILHSQTHTFLAIKVYESLGWKPYRPESQSQEEFEEGWSIVRERLRELT